MITCIGHRGAAGHQPENTLLSFQHAIDFGVDYIEFDVQLTRDGELVILHDKRVDRTTDGMGYIAEMSLEEVKALDAGAGQRIPTLLEVTSLANNQVGLMIEIIDPGATAKTVRQVSKTFKGPVIYASFHHRALAEVRSMLPDAQTLALLEGVPVHPTAFARDAAVTHVGLSIDSLTADFVNCLRNEGYKVFVYTANDPRDISWLMSLPVDGIITNYPERVIATR